MCSLDLSKEESVIGRDLHDMEKYGKEGTAFLGKVVMSAGEKPVLGRRILADISKPHVVLICGKRGYGKCLTGDTEIILSNGEIKKIRDLENSNQDIATLDFNYKIKNGKKEGFTKRTVNKILKIKTRTGKEIELTPEHPLLTVHGWQDAKELIQGNRIATPRVLPFFGKEFLTESQVKLLAYFTAEGHTMHNYTWFTNFDEKIIDDFKLSVKNFDSNLSIKESKEGQFRVVNVSNFKRKILKDLRNNGKFTKGIIHNKQNKMKEWLISVDAFGKKAIEKNIPHIVFKLPKTKIALFLNRLFSCDGTIWKQGKKYWRISHSTSSQKMAYQIQHLLLRFGIISNVRKRLVHNQNKEFDSYEIYFNGRNAEMFLLKIGFFGKKEERQKQAMEFFKNIEFNENIDTIPKEIWDYYKPNNWAEVGRKMNYSIPKSLRESTRYAPTRQKLLQIAKVDNNKLIEKFANSDIFWDEIDEIKEIEGSFEVYDFCVPENHNFVANDIIVHNSYTMSVFLEEMTRLPLEIKNRISTIVIDTVGIFWSLKIPTKEGAKDLENWDLKPEGSDVRVLVPKGTIDFYKEKEVPVDGTLTLAANELTGTEWMALFNLSWKDSAGILINRITEEVRERMNNYFGIEDLINAVKNDTEADDLTKKALMGRLDAAKSWGLIERSGTQIQDIAMPGAITVIDVSSYRQTAGMEGTRDIIVALIGKRLFEERMLYRKEEEIKMVKGLKKESQMPIIWMFIDEAHMFMPKDEKSLALNVLLEWVRVGRQPGLSLCLATQRPARLHPDAISQCDMFISMRMTQQDDIAAVGSLRPSYLHQSFDKYFEQMPKSKGYSIILDDNSEKLWLVKIRPRLSWDAGVTASAFFK